MFHRGVDERSYLAFCFLNSHLSLNQAGAVPYNNQKTVIKVLRETVIHPNLYLFGCVTSYISYTPVQRRIVNF